MESLTVVRQCTSCWSSSSHRITQNVSLRNQTVGAGTHVRNAATIGGNLALARDRHLESDLATVLMGAGAEVECVPLRSCADASSAR